MTGQYSYPPPPLDGQGASPSNSNMALPPLNLPPIRNLDGSQQPQPLQQQQQQQQQPQGQQGAQAPMASPMAPAMNQYYGQQGQPFQPANDPNAPQRWPLPPDGRVMSGGRHKKEIKRRTKTGCLTCRKRRIKCDEAHPACRNCQKSKRECLGYDPIFKSQQGTTNIQPALGGAPPLRPDSANSSPYPPPPQGYMHAGPHNYAQPGTNSGTSTGEPYDYGAAIDPALEGGGTAPMQDNKRNGGSGSPYAQDGPEQQGPRAAKRTKVEELLCLRGYPPPPPAPLSQLPTTSREELKHIWITVYAPAIDKFLETRWFVLRGLNFLMENDRLCNQFSALLSRFTTPPNPADPYAYQQHYITQSLEATVIWAMMGLCRQAANAPKSESDEGDSPDVKDGVLEAAKRLEIFEALVTGEYLDAQSALQEPGPENNSNGPAFHNQLKSREREFWRHVHTFLTIRDDEASAAKEIDETLANCRSRLDGRENRDVVYSIIIARHVGARVAEFPNNLQQAESDDEKENRNKLLVAKRFIEDQMERGTNQVVQRMCGMAAKSWVVKR